MQFFNKYKDLFGVPQGLGVPSSRLQLDNDLFIEKTYVPTKTQEYSLNGKLRELKKDYHEFEHRIDEMTKMRMTPKRSSSRKDNQSFVKQSNMHQKGNENNVSSLPKLTPLRVLSKTYDYQRDRQKMMSDKKKRESWLKEEGDIIKNSELDHIFSNKLNNIYDLEEIKPSTLPKPNLQMSYSPESRPQKNTHFTIKQRSRQKLQKLQKVQTKVVGGDNARGRREKAKDNLQYRRRRLQQLLRTLW